jgi:SAM-dependent methyltransferase
VTNWTIETEGRQAFELARIYCGDCRDYHMTRAFLKAGGHQLGPERDRAMLAPLLRRLTPPRGRVLIAGAADTGMLDFTLSAIGDLDPQITVLDQCATPLILCERFAEASGVSITTIKADLATAGDGPFDLIIGHVLMSFVAADQRLAVLRQIARMLAPGGTFLLAVTKPRAGLAARGMRLPGDGSEVTSALQRHLQHHRPDSGGGAAALELIEPAGLMIAERHNTESERPAPGAENRPSRLYIALRRAG